jgi:NAD(P)-dependent dehydrogenase (short-subunit alcohol dehydrogenase family)
MEWTNGWQIPGHIVVTGGAQGIGEAVVRNALSRGASVTFVDTNKEAGEALAAELGQSLTPGQQVFFDVCDVTQADQLQASVARATEIAGPVTGLVNNAGRNANFSVTDMTEGEWDEFFALDLKAAWLCARQVVPGMVDHGSGAIVNVASVHGHMTQEGHFPYGAAKSGLIGLTRTLAIELGPMGIRVNSVSPGYTRTPQVEAFLSSMGTPDVQEKVLSKHALRRIGEPSEVADVIVFLLSPQATFVTGTDVVVDGGISARYA